MKKIVRKLLKRINFDKHLFFFGAVVTSTILLSILIGRIIYFLMKE